MSAMPRTRPPAPTPPPLLVWREVSEIERIEAEIARLAERMAKLRPHSHARLQLQFRARQLRERQIRLECELRGRQ